MAVNPSFKAFVTEQLAGVGPFSIRGMFGGAGVFADGVMFALVYQDTLYLKTDTEGAKVFESEGAKVFTYETKEGTHTLGSYWQVPERLYDEPDEMTEWARRALGVAKSLQKPKAPKSARGKSKPDRSSRR